MHFRVNETVQAQIHYRDPQKISQLNFSYPVKYFHQNISRYRGLCGDKHTRCLPYEEKSIKNALNVRIETYHEVSSSSKSSGSPKRKASEVSFCCGQYALVRGGDFLCRLHIMRILIVVMTTPNHISPRAYQQISIQAVEFCVQNEIF